MAKKPLIIILIGKSGSGKGTQADLLIEKFKLDYIGSGDLLRARAKNNDFTGKKSAQTLKSGGLFPTPVIFKLWLDKVEHLKNKNNFKGVVMDGNPRKIMEAYLMDELFNWYEWKGGVNAVLINISDKEVINRLSKRRVCKKCGEIIPSVGEYKTVKKCPKCGGELIKRSDDNLASVKKRLVWFKKEVSPIVEYYKRTKRLVKVNGEQSIDKVFKDILKCIK